MSVAKELLSFVCNTEPSKLVQLTSQAFFALTPTNYNFRVFQVRQSYKAAHLAPV